MPATTSYTSIFDLVAPDHHVEIRGEKFKIQKVGPEELVLLLKRFPSITQIQDLDLAAFDDENMDLSKLDPAKLEMLATMSAYNVAMATVALGHRDNPEAEAQVAALFDQSEQIRIIVAAQELSMKTPDEGFSKRSA
ncbi:hypothetical protein NZL82_01595 [Sphingomonas sanguinis]|uniref:hypothetical protein n=1 Tax=Sphingomonas sp. LC-1 TaxID=3110957 RepID=UPI0021BB8A9A|nr:hypothetical protein [Sphingomonas sp. LC-1]MCT8000565.1 hypothetical protein [Sphingomonas sp. LC-1]